MDVIILAAQRAGEINSLAQVHGVSHKCLVPIGGAPLIAHVLAAVTATDGIASIRIVVEPEAFDPIRAIALPFTGAIPVEYIRSATNITDSIRAGMAGCGGRVIITTADNVQVTPAALTAMRSMLESGADVAIAMARKSAVLAAHPEGQRRFYKFADDSFSNCNLYAMRGSYALKAAEAFRGGGQFAKSAKRIIDAFGLANLILLRLGWLSLEGALQRVSKRFGLTIKPVILEDGRHAIDVDNERTYRIAEALMLSQPSASSTAALASASSCS
jgi:CTP:molybdopterin cytidylyltransferase MocA